MQTSLFLAQLLGPVLLVIGIAVLTDRPHTRALSEEFLRSPALLFLAGLLALVPGLAIILTHNVWTADWRVLITLLGWLMTISGVIRILLPNRVTLLGQAILSKNETFTISGGVTLLLGAVLTVCGFF